MHRPFDSTPQEDRHARLERALIEEYLGRRGETLASAQTLPREQFAALMKEASLYASGRLCEVECRAQLIGELHHGHEPQEREPHALAGTDAGAAVARMPAPPPKVERDDGPPVRPVTWVVL